MQLYKLMQAAFVVGAFTVLSVGGCALYAPSMLWLAFVASIAVGYLAYEFSEVLKAIPTAFSAVRDTFSAVIKIGGSVMNSAAESIAAFFNDRHPFLYSTVACGAMLSALTVYVMVPLPNPELNHSGRVVALLLMFWLVGWIVSGLLSCWFATAGQKTLGEDTYEYDIETGDYGYAQFAWWLGVGFVSVFFRHIPSGCMRLVRLIHSSKRLMVAIDGPLGGILALTGFYLYGPATASPVEYFTVVIAGGVISAALVAANYELISRRIFGIA